MAPGNERTRANKVNNAFSAVSTASEKEQLKKLPERSIGAHNIFLAQEDRVIARLQAEWASVERGKQPNTLHTWKELTANTLTNRINEINTGKVNGKQVASAKPSILTLINEHLSDAEIKALPARLDECVRKSQTKKRQRISS